MLGLQIAARIAVQSGAAGIIVSNHGARQLDYVPATIMALEEVLTTTWLCPFCLPETKHVIIFWAIDDLRLLKLPEVKFLFSWMAVFDVEQTFSKHWHLEHLAYL